MEGRVDYMHLAHGIQEGDGKGKKGRKGGQKDEKVRRKREHKTALKNRPQRYSFQ